MRKLKPDFEEVSPLKMIPDDIRIKLRRNLYVVLGFSI